MLPSPYILILQTSPATTIFSVFDLFYSINSFSLFWEICKHIISRVAVNWNFLLQLGFYPLSSQRLYKVILIFPCLENIIKLYMHFQWSWESMHLGTRKTDILSLSWLILLPDRMRCSYRKT